MTELFDKLNDKARDIANIRLADLIMDVDLLTVALSADVFPETMLALKDAQEGDRRYVAAHKAIDIGFNNPLRDKALKEGFFAKGARGLLKLADQEPDTGARLMPVFNTMVSSYRYYGISKKLKHEIEAYMERKRQNDGFAILKYTEDGKVIIKAAAGLFDD
jgi:hypothetical protein